MDERVHRDPDIFRIRLPFANLGAGESNCYVLRSGDDWLVVDAGAATERGRRLLAGALRSLGVDFSRCTAFLTHGHFDHAGLLGAVLPARVPLVLTPAAFEARQPGRRAEMQREFRDRMAALGASFEDACAYAACNAETVPLPPRRFAYRFADEGDEVAVGSLRFRVLATPGHTPDHLCLWEPERGILFSGDLVLRTMTPSVDLFPDGADGLGCYLSQLQRVRDLVVSSAFPGHGAPLDGPAFRTAIDDIDHRKRERAERIAQFLSQNPAATGEEIVRSALARRSPAAWRALLPMSRYYFMLEAWTALRHLGIADGALPRGGHGGDTAVETGR